MCTYVSYVVKLLRHEKHFRIKMGNSDGRYCHWNYSYIFTILG